MSALMNISCAFLMHVKVWQALNVVPHSNISFVFNVTFVIVERIFKL